MTDLVGTRNAMLKREQDIYITTVKQINMRMKELVTQELGQPSLLSYLEIFAERYLEGILIRQIII